MKSIKERFMISDQILYDRFELLPKMMENANIDMWIIMSREYNEDPVVAYLTPSDFLTSRRLTILCFYYNGKTVERYHLGRPDYHLKDYYTQAYDESKHSQMEALSELIKQKSPETIGINQSQSFALADGLSKTLYDELVDCLDEKYVNRLVSAEYLSLNYLETRVEKEWKIYDEACRISKEMIHDTFSLKHIEINKTTTADLEWVLKQKCIDKGLPFWFAPTVDLQRPQIGILDGDTVIKRGDLLHCDFGLVYMNMCTDTQRLAYILKEGEHKIPEDLLYANKINQRFRDIVTSQFAFNKSGNDVFSSAKKIAKQEGIDNLLYSHPIGFYGHGPGPTIGLYNDQNPIPVKGDYPLHYNTCYALELTTITYVESMGMDVRMMTEETIAFKEDGVYYLMKDHDKIITVGGLE